MKPPGSQSLTWRRETDCDRRRRGPESEELTFFSLTAAAVEPCPRVLETDRVFLLDDAVSEAHRPTSPSRETDRPCRSFLCRTPPSLPFSFTDEEEENSSRARSSKLISGNCAFATISLGTSSGGSIGRENRLRLLERRPALLESSEVEAPSAALLVVDLKADVAIVLVSKSSENGRN